MRLTDLSPRFPALALCFAEFLAEFNSCSFVIIVSRLCFSARLRPHVFFSSAMTACCLSLSFFFASVSNTVAQEGTLSSSLFWVFISFPTAWRFFQKLFIAKNFAPVKLSPVSLSHNKSLRFLRCFSKKSCHKIRWLFFKVLALPPPPLYICLQKDCLLNRRSGLTIEPTTSVNDFLALSAFCPRWQFLGVPFAFLRRCR